MDLDLPCGPWTRLVTAEWGDYPVSLYVNDEKVLLLVIFERRNGEPSGALVVAKKVFLTDFDFTKVSASQRRDVTVIDKLSADKSVRYVLVGATPEYSACSQEDLTATITKQMNELKAASVAIGELAKAYGAKVKDLSQAGEGDVQLLLGDPFLLFTMASQQTVSYSLEPAKAVLGSSDKGELVEVPLSSISFAVAVGGSRGQRLRAVQALCESALTSNIPCLVFDSTGSFAGLSRPNPDTKDFTRSKMTPMPLGFPVREFKLGRGFYIDLSQVSSDLFTKAFGFSDTDAGNAVAKAWAARERHSLSDVVELLEEKREKLGLNQYEAAKAVRVLKVIEKENSVFAKNPPSDLMMPWHEGIGKVLLLDSAGVSGAVRHILVSYVLGSLSVQRGKAIKALVAFDDEVSALYDDVIDYANLVRGGSIAFAFHSPDDIGVSLIKSPTLRIDFIGKDAVAFSNGEKPRRFSLRPTYTQPAQ